jgi:glycosyltransferase involved in cell wall biosynthesis
MHDSTEDYLNESDIVIAIDASRNRSGGAKAHLLGMLKSCDPRKYGVRAIHVWSYDALLAQLPNVPWLIKHSPKELNGSLLKQIWWQRQQLPVEIELVGCNVLLSTDAGTVCRFKPDIVMSRDMLSFEGREMLRYPLFSFSRLRLRLLKWLQIRSLQKASGALFLTQYAADTIQCYTGNLKTVRIIPHGIGDNFRRAPNFADWPDDEGTVRCTYVSNADLYKHQWHVVEAMAMLRKAGFNVCLNLVGAGTGLAADKVIDAVERFDKDRSFVKILPAQTHEEVARHLFDSDIFIFASSCENMPNTLVEAMAAGLPIACANRGPMPEVLQRGGVYFNPEDPASIFEAVKKIIENNSLRANISRISLERSQLFSWERCARETWQYLVDIKSSNTHYSRLK